MKASRISADDVMSGFGAVAMLSAFGLIAGLCFGGFYGFTGAREALAERNTLRAQCVAGNDRACKLYEVDYGD